MLIHSTAGLTVFEARLRGCRVISYGWGVVAHPPEQRGLPALRAGRASSATRAGPRTPRCVRRSPSRACPTRPTRSGRRPPAAVLGADRRGRVSAAPRAARRAGLAAGAAWSLPALAPIVPPVAGALRVPLRRPGAAGVALTFDDGPHPQGTPATLRRSLAAAGARATFFLVGEQVRAYPALAAEIVAAGHEVARPRRPPPQPAARSRRGRSPTTWTAPPPRSARSPGARRRCTARRTASTRTPGLALVRRARLAPAAVVALGPRLVDARRRRGRSPRGSRATWPRATSCCCTTPTGTATRARGAATVAALPRVLERIARRLRLDVADVGRRARYAPAPARLARSSPPRARQPQRRRRERDRQARAGDAEDDRGGARLGEMRDVAGPTGS